MISSHDSGLEIRRFRTWNIGKVDTSELCSLWGFLLGGVCLDKQRLLASVYFGRRNKYGFFSKALLWTNLKQSQISNLENEIK